MRKQRKIETQKSVIKKYKKMIESDGQVTVKKEQGITLIALVVTIIIMLILAGVALTMALGENGLIGKARYAREEERYASVLEERDLWRTDYHMLDVADSISDGTGNAKTREQIASELKNKGLITEEEMADILDKNKNYTCKINGKDIAFTLEFLVDRSNLHIGDEVKYIPVSEKESYELTMELSGYKSAQTITKEDYKWKIINIGEDGTVDIMGIPEAEPKQKTYYFQGVIGYHNVVWVLNEVCEQLYSNTTLGLKARSIKIEDIESHMTNEGKTARATVRGSSKQYGETQQYEGNNAYYPQIAKYENHVGIGDSLNVNGKSGSYDGRGINGLTIPLLVNDNSTTLQADKITVQETGCRIPYASTNSSYFDDENFLNLIFGTGTWYFLASRCSECYGSMASFGHLVVDPWAIYGCDLFRSNNTNGTDDYHIAPVVTLGRNIEFTADGENKWVLNK